MFKETFKNSYDNKKTKLTIESSLVSHPLRINPRALLFFEANNLALF